MVKFTLQADCFIYRSILSASLTSIEEGTRLGLHPHPGQLYPGHPDRGLGHVGQAGVHPVHVQEDSVSSLQSTGRTSVTITAEVLQERIGGPPPAPNHICILHMYTNRKFEIFKPETLTFTTLTLVHSFQQILQE